MPARDEHGTPPAARGGPGTPEAVEAELRRHYQPSPHRDGHADPGGDELGYAVPWAERLARVTLTRVADPGDDIMGRALRERGPDAALRAARTGQRLPRAGEGRTESYAARAARADPLADLAAAWKAGARFLCPGDGDWPAQLDDLGAQRPYGLWVRGRPSLRLWALRSVAVVGARTCTDYGAHMAARLGAGLSAAGWAVVSGAAYGIDAVVHRSALAAGGATIGVVASGVDVPYPPGNAQLIGQIAEHGLLIGELPPGDHPTRARFVLRNRVIAALTRGTVVVEARYRSGSLITARRAAALGRVTMGIPGPCTSGLSEGVHELLRADALVVTDAAEVAELVGEIGADLAPARHGPILPRDRLPAPTARVLDALPAHGHADTEDIATAAGATARDTLGRLYELQALGFVERHKGRWTLVRTTRNPTSNRDG
ncbi:DNA processing protein [Streptomyces sp. DvalAA-14]|uniref:DNA-processing protein DprA n=1 Tax=unclassified Streptomyces TaxID=2593676 RepID=UPI00081AF114|nr:MULTISPECIES: DNA-processing protein DprA [unclassified Streptomyces]MYS22044.1 DNA-protecting protein DprA [Streptomyces sp. SID4948]SCE07410.1 DNA processing protein [Streptomyces sp. DvalAA-14]